MKKILGRWISIHLSYDFNIEKFIVEEIVPVLQDQTPNSPWFFIRYKDSSQHLRIRVFDTSFECNKEKRIIRKLSDRLKKYLKKNNINSEFQNQNAIRIGKYTAEIERYGGDYGLKISEEHFHHSSITITDLFRNPNWNYNYSLGIALRIHTIFSMAMSTNYFEHTIFYKIYCQNWTEFVTEQPSNTRKIGEFYKAYKKASEPHIDEIVLFIKHINKPEKLGIISRWVIICNELFIKLDVPKIKPPEYYRRYKDKGIRDRTAIIFSLAESYIHMTNNRLGIKNIDEGYLAYILMRVFKQISQK